jgi:signal transduction histidine kinase
MDDATEQPSTPRFVRWKLVALIVVLVVVVVVVLLILGDTLGINHQGHSLAPSLQQPSTSTASFANGG